MQSGFADKSWINLEFPNAQFIEGVSLFISLAQDRLNTTHIPCPCSLCMNRGKAQASENVEVHLYKHGFHKSYVHWNFHGEKSERGRETTQDTYASTSSDNYSVDEIGANDAWNTLFEEMRTDGHNLDPLFESQTFGVEDRPSLSSVDPLIFNEKLKDALSDLYAGCDDFSVLRFSLQLFKIKTNSGWTEKSFTELLRFLKMVFPLGNKVPESTYQVEKLVKELGLNYKKIDACPNDCILYWEENKDLDRCPTCKESRYKVRTLDERKKHVKSPAKVLRYFPITDRLRRMYSVEWVAKEMQWHSNNKLRDGVLGHPVDSSSWKIIDFLYKDFARPRNVRLGLATDGFNPFGVQSNSYSCWPVMCVVYNLPPWLCMKPQFTMLALLIDGPKQPGKDIDIYFRPLVDELKMLWKTGVVIEDASDGLPFTMRVVLLWTIHDFPAYGDVSGHRVKSKNACPVCGPNTTSIRLHHGMKNAFLGNRCFLCMTDLMRKDVRASSFNREEELRPQPMRLSGEEIIKMTKDLNVKWGKGGGCGSGEDNVNNCCFCKLSIFFELEYWEFLPIRHNLDVMHIEKNVCEILLALMLDTPQKTKDDNKARKDLELLDIKPRYWLTADKKKKLGPFCLRADEKKIFLSTLKDMRVPVGFSSSWYNIVLRGAKAKDLKGMKSHDYHILIQHLLPVLIQHAYKDRPQSRNVIQSFSTFFRALCSKRVEVETMKILERGMVKTLCELEKMCPPSIFVIMMHLPIHLAYEARVLGPVFYRWMYLFERMMKEYKSYVTNKARPEGCIAEAYLREETMIYCDGYKGGGGLLDKLEDCIEGRSVTKSTELMMETDAFGPVGKGTYYSLEGVEYEQVRRWILKSHSEYDKWEGIYKQFVDNLRIKSGKKTSHFKVGDKDEFIPWLRKQSDLLNDEESDIVRGPICDAMSYSKYSINGYLFITKDHEKNRRNQNSGVTTNCPTTLRSSAKDKNPIDMSVEYYGVVRKIIQVKYRSGYSAVVFKCDWVKLRHGVKFDEETKLLMVNMSNIIRSSHINDEPFILAEHVSQVFYSKDPLNPDWHVVIEVPRKQYSDLDSVGLIPEETTVDESFVIPTNPEFDRDDELIFSDATDMVDAVDAPNKRKRRVVASQKRKRPVTRSQSKRRRYN